VKVRNLSSTATAVNAAVHLFRGPFGIGMPRVLDSTRVVTLAPNREVEILFPLTQAALSGDPRTSIHVQIEHSADQRLINNRGAQIMFGVLTSQAGRDLQFRFPVRNPLAAAQQITLAVLGNELGAAVLPTTRFFGPLEQVLATLTCQVPGDLHAPAGSSLIREVTVVGRGGDGEVIDGITHFAQIDD
jgi:hypothetical protein